MLDSVLLSTWSANGQRVGNNSVRKFMVVFCKLLLKDSSELVFKHSHKNAISDIDDSVTCECDRK